MIYRATACGDNAPGPVTICPKQAAREFFATYPLRKKCHVWAGHYVNGEFRPLHWRPGLPRPVWPDICRANIETMGERRRAA